MPDTITITQKIARFVSKVLYLPTFSDEEVFVIIYPIELYYKKT